MRAAWVKQLTPTILGTMRSNVGYWHDHLVSTQLDEVSRQMAVGNGVFDWPTVSALVPNTYSQINAQAPGVITQNQTQTLMAYADNPDNPQQGWVYNLAYAPGGLASLYYWTFSTLSQFGSVAGNISCPTDPGTVSALHAESSFLTDTGAILTAAGVFTGDPAIIAAGAAIGATGAAVDMLLIMCME